MDDYVKILVLITASCAQNSVIFISPWFPYSSHSLLMYFPEICQQKACHWFHGKLEFLGISASYMLYDKSLGTPWSICMESLEELVLLGCQDVVIKWKHFLCYWPLVWGIHRSLVNSPRKSQWCRALMFSLICVWTNIWANGLDAGDLRHHHARYDVTVMLYDKSFGTPWSICMESLEELLILGYKHADIMSGILEY